MTGRSFRAVLSATLLGVGLLKAIPLGAQVPQEGEVRQFVTFLLQPGQSAEVYRLYREEAIPLYRQNPAMLSVRALREVESPTPLDLVSVSAFDGMEGMDASNGELRRLSTEAGTSIGGLYGQIARPLPPLRRVGRHANPRLG
ncbi:MAG: hypothetical protein AAF389_06445 [Gemmatimonadota bacterium]